MAVILSILALLLTQNGHILNGEVYTGKAISNYMSAQV